MDKDDSASTGSCPFSGGARAYTNRDWWPNQLDIQVLHRHSPLSDPMGAAFDYPKEFNSLDLDAVIRDLHALMTDSQEWAGRAALVPARGPTRSAAAWKSSGPGRRRNGATI